MRPSHVDSTCRPLIIALLLSFGLSSCGTSAGPTIPNEVSEAYQSMEITIHDYLKTQQGIRGFGGTVFCISELLGGDAQSFYLIGYCQEYYPAADSLSKGSGSIVPAKLTVQDRQVVSYTAPKDGSAYTADVRKIFPPGVATWILDSEFKQQLNRRLQHRMDSLVAIHREALLANHVDGPFDLTGRWELTHINDTLFDMRQTYGDDPQPYIIFDLARSMIGGWNGCNNFGLQITLNDSSYTSGELLSDARGCYPGWLEQFDGILEDNQRYEVQGDTLQLTNSEGRILAFKRAR